MKHFTKILFFFLAVFAINAKTQAQNPDLEFTTASASGNGPVLSSTFTFVGNTNNPTGTTYAAYSPTAGQLTTTFTSSNPQYTTVNYGTGATPNPLVFGMSIGAAATINTIFGGGPTANFFTASDAPTGTGIDIGANNQGIRVYLGTKPLELASAPTTGTYYMADLTVTFNRAVNNPILHFSGMGGATGLQSFSAEFELIGLNGSTPATGTLAKLSGTTPLYVTSANYIGNNATPMNTTGTAAASGSVQVNGTGITTLTFKVYMRGFATSGTPTAVWDNTNNPASLVVGDAFTISVSTLETDLAVTKTVDNATPVAGSNVTFTVNATNNGISNSPNTIVDDLLPSGYTYVSSTTTVGSYNSGTGVWSIGTLNTGVTETMTIVATVNNSGSLTNIATVSGSNSEPTLTNNTATVVTAPLPVRLLSFTAKQIEENVSLNWATAMEENASRFEIQYSLGSSFKTIANVTAEGNSSTLLNYTWLHNTPANGNNYYRLKMIDADGTFSYSRIISIRIGKLGDVAINVYPNPVHNLLTVDLPKPAAINTLLNVYNNEGKLILSKSIQNAQSIPLQVSKFTTGIYYIIITENGQPMFETKFVKM